MWIESSWEARIWPQLLFKPAEKFSLFRPAQIWFSRFFQIEKFCDYKRFKSMNFRMAMRRAVNPIIRTNVRTASQVTVIIINSSAENCIIWALCNSFYFDKSLVTRLQSRKFWDLKNKRFGIESKVYILTYM
jgi:hypothetical protein